MISLALMLTLTVSVQGSGSNAPDRSTPEKAAEGFVRWQEERVYNSRDLVELVVAAQRIGSEHLTGDAKTELEKRHAKSRSRMTRVVRPDVRTRVTKRVENANGTVTLDVTVVVSRPSTKTDGSKRTQKRLARLQFKKMGDVWLIRKAGRHCSGCAGKLVCPVCLGL